jgi:hypothetical protein
MKKFIFDELTKYVQVGVVSGSDLVKKRTTW